MTGAGGFGKSQVCMAIKEKLGSLVSITAMTGKAGSLISGTTLHSFAHLPIKKTKNAPYHRETKNAPYHRVL